MHLRGHGLKSMIFVRGVIRDWSLITARLRGGGGGYKTGGGGHVKFYPYEKGGAENVLAMLKGGHKEFWGSFYVEALSFSHIVGGARKVSTL